MVKWGELTIENQSFINERAKEKKDGVYISRGIVYRVRNGKPTHYACKGVVVCPYGNFNVEIGEYSGYNLDAQRLLKTIKD